MDYHRQIDSWHVFVAPREYVLISLQEVRQVLPYRLAGHGAHSCRPSGSRFIEHDFFQLFYRFCDGPLLANAQGLLVILHFQYGDVAFPGGHLVSSQLPNSVLRRELNHQMVC